MSVKCTMILGDCLDVLPAFPALSAHLLVADLPYQITNLTWDKAVDAQRLYCWWKGVRRPGAAALFYANFTHLLELLKTIGKDFRYELIWSKSRGTNGLVAHKRPVPSHEYIGVFGSPPLAYCPQKEQSCQPARIRTQRTGSRLLQISSSGQKKLHVSDGDRFPLSVRRVSQDNLSRNGAANNRNTIYHPTQKPVELNRWLIRSYSVAGGTVVDPCSGSASSALASASEARHGVFVEKDVHFFELGIERMGKHVRDNNLDVKIEVRR